MSGKWRYSIIVCTVLFILLLLGNLIYGIHLNYEKGIESHKHYAEKKNAEFNKIYTKKNSTEFANTANNSLKKAEEIYKVDTLNNKINNESNNRETLIDEGEISFHGFAHGMEELVSSADEIADQYGIPKQVYPYRESLNEINSILLEKGYDKTSLFSSYTEMLKNEGLISEINIPKTINIISLSKNYEANIFVDKIENIFDNKQNLGYLLINLDVHHSLGMVEDIFSDVKKIIEVADQYESQKVDKRAIIHYAVRTATFFGYAASDAIAIVEDKHNAEINLGCSEILTALELSGEL